MALSENQLRWIEEGIQLAVAAVLAAVRASKGGEEMDWSKLRITETPEEALEKARRTAKEVSSHGPGRAGGQKPGVRS